MELGCIGSSPVMFMPESGLMGSVMGVAYILARMEVGMLGSLSGVSNMDLVIINSGKSLLSSLTYMKRMDMCFDFHVLVYDIDVWN